MTSLPLEKKLEEIAFLRLRAVNPQTREILRIDRDGMIDDVTSGDAVSVDVILRLLRKKKVHCHTT